jgi:flagellar biosynthesis/type III secretory pathway protein FliH
LFRIDRRLVNLAGTKYIKLQKEVDDIDVEDEDPEVDAEGESPDAAASAAAMVQEYLSEAETKVNKEKEQILEAAREEAAIIIITAREDAEEARKKAWQEGYTEGAAEGKRSYDKQLAEKISEDDQMLARVLEEIHEERERTYAAMEEEVINLSLEIVKKIINPAEEAVGGVFTSLIKNALKQMSTDGKIIIRVSPVEYERFFSSGAAVIELDSGVVVTASVLRDVSLNEGDCIIDTDNVTVNAGIDSQLKYVKLAFESANQYEPD